MSIPRCKVMEFPVRKSQCKYVDIALAFLETVKNIAEMLKHMKALRFGHIIVAIQYTEEKRM